MSSTEATTPEPNRWIVSPVYDLLFFVGTPLLCLAAMLPLRGMWSSMSIYVAVMAFSSFGHHLPGFLRAYGDADLFKRYRARFLLAPPIIYGVFFWFGMRDLHGMVLILMAWSVWHVMMQHFGFMRIYDAKVGSTRASTAWLDRLVSLCWFVSIVLWSPEYTHNFVNAFYEAGGFVLPLGLVEGVRWGVWGATGLVTLAYVMHTARLLATGQPVSLVKLVLLVVTLGFLWIVWVGIRDIFLGLAIWEVFHDIQYFAVTWIYNRRLVEKGFGTTQFMRFLFRRRAPLVGLYIGAIALYGGLNWVIVTKTTATLATVGIAFVYTSTLLHYYFDGFIWKVRQQRTRMGLDLETAVAAAGRSGLPTGLRSATWQVLLFALPIGSLAAMELYRPVADPVVLRESIRAIAPTAVVSHLNAGLAYAEAGMTAEAVEAYAKAVQVAPDDPRAHGGYATALIESAGPAGVEEAASHLLRAQELDPSDTVYTVNLALLRFHEGQVDEAITLFESAVVGDPTWAPRSPGELLLYGYSRLAAGESELAFVSFLEVIESDPADIDALAGLAAAATAQQRYDVAGDALSALLQIRPGHYPYQVAYVQSLLQQGRQAEAVPILETILAERPEDYDRMLMLAEILATSPDEAVRNGAEAVRLANLVAMATLETNVGALDILAAAHAEAGDFDRAVHFAGRALELAQRQQLADVLGPIQARRLLYKQGYAYRAGMLEGQP